MKRPASSSLFLRYGPAAFMTAFVPVLSLLPARFFRPVESHLPPVPALDKAVHAILYAALTAAWLHAAPHARRASLATALGTAFAATAFGLLMEAGQGALTATRTMDPLDALANAAGAFSSALIFAAAARRRTP